MPYSDEYEFLDYINSRTKCHVRCKNCNHVWLVLPNAFNTRKYTCPNCGPSRNEKISKSVTQYYKDNPVYRSTHRSKNK